MLAPSEAVKVLASQAAAHPPVGQSLATTVAKQLKADASLIGQVLVYQERVGGRFGANPPATVGFEAKVVARQEDLFLLHFNSETPILDLLEKHGAMPLPPYISHAPDSMDEERYQTVYARDPGAVAAPTAGLHFDAGMLESLRQQGINIAYVTLHVGAGTFQPVRTDIISEHKMHSELYSVPEKTVGMVKAAQAQGGTVTAVGTTALRALESAARTGELLAGSGETDIFITPGYQFKVVERLLTNFHLPKSTLFMLVSAFAGVNHVRQAYQHAIEKRYRFFSYGDAMLIERA